jgi:hypothetical protein
VKRFVNSMIVLGLFWGHAGVITAAWLALLFIATGPALGFAAALLLAGVLRRTGPVLAVRYINWRVGVAKAGQS